MKSQITVRSYAKVNYTLDVLSPRPDGYHGIASIMQAISLADSIHFAVLDEPGIALACSDPDIPSDSRNLAWRAAELVLQETGTRKGLHIRIDKRIPSQAGLGGGSSNAAYTLMAVNRMTGAQIDPPRLMELAAELGSDVPFFLHGGTAAVRGRGELVSALSDGPSLWFVIVKPEQNVSTGAAFAALDAIADRHSARSTRKMEQDLAAGDIDRIIARMTNDFEEVICAENRTIALLHDELMMARARNSRLCGSGSAVFGVTTDKRSADEIARVMRLKYAKVFVCRALTRDESLNQEPEVSA